MHEASLVQALLDQVQAVAAAHGRPRIRAVRVRLGALAGADGESLRFAFAALRAAAGLPDAELVLEPVAARLRCAACGAETAPVAALRCAACGGAGELIHGRELELTALDVEDENGNQDRQADPGSK